MTVAEKCAVLVVCASKEVGGSHFLDYLCRDVASFYDSHWKLGSYDLAWKSVAELLL